MVDFLPCKEAPLTRVIPLNAPLKAPDKMGTGLVRVGVRVGSNLGMLKLWAEFWRLP